MSAIDHRLLEDLFVLYHDLGPGQMHEMLERIEDLDLFGATLQAVALSTSAGLVRAELEDIDYHQTFLPRTAAALYESYASDEENAATLRTAVALMACDGQRDLVELFRDELTIDVLMTIISFGTGFALATKDPDRSLRDWFRIVTSG